MEAVVEKVTCSTCKNGIRMHRRYYTYDNRMIEFYQWGCSKSEKKLETSQKIKECSIWEKAAD